MPQGSSAVRPTNGLLVPFEVLPLRLDAAIPAPLPMLEILSKIFNGNAAKGRQRFAGGP